MKKLLTLFFAFIIFGCSDSLSPNEETNYRIIAYESLDKGSKESIIVDRQDAPVLKGTYHTGSCTNLFVSSSNSDNRMCFFTNDKDLQLKLLQDLIAVSFNTNNDALLGPIIVIIDPQKEKVIGFVGRL